MPIEIESNVDYEQVCRELNISLDDLITFAKNKNNFQINSKKIKFKEMQSEFISNLEKKVNNKRKSSKTLKDYKEFLNQFNKFIENKQLEPFYVDNLTESIMYDFFDTCKPLKGDKLSPYTINKYLGIIRSLIKFAYMQGHINRDYSYRFDLLKTFKFPRYFTDDQIEQILKYSIKRTYGYRWRAMVYFLLYTGCRINEATNLKVKDFDIENNVILVTGKGNKERYIPMYEKMKDVVLRYLKMTHLSEWSRNNSGYLFSRDDGDLRKVKISNRSLQYQISNILHDADLNEHHYTPHSFRHTFAVNCLKKGMELPYLSQVLGHTNPETTNIYVKMLPQDLRDEIMKSFPFPFEKLLNDIIN